MHRSLRTRGGPRLSTRPVARRLVRRQSAVERAARQPDVPAERGVLRGVTKESAALGGFTHLRARRWPEDLRGSKVPPPRATPRLTPRGPSHAKAAVRPRRAALPQSREPPSAGDTASA